MKYICAAVMAAALAGFWHANEITRPTLPEKAAVVPVVPPGAGVITLGMGCFWHGQAVFEKIPGVLSVTVGYMGGATKNPTHGQVAAGNSGHAEVSRVVFDPARTSLAGILKVFWAAHHPTQLNPGAGRSVIFYHTPEQREIAEKSLAEAARAFSSPIVTQIAPAGEFFAAEEYHQDYYAKAQRQCSVADASQLEAVKLK